MAAIDVFMQGNMVVVRAPFYAPEGGVPDDYTPDPADLTDPATVTFTARRRGDAEASAYIFETDDEVTRTVGEEVGVFDLTFLPDVGHWYVHAQGTGPAYAASEIEFDIDDSKALAS